MSLQHTMLALFLPLMVTQTVPDSAIARLGRSASIMTIEGTLSTEGTQSLSGVPFTARVHEDTLDMTIAGPFGITAARIHVEPDSFVAVNYLTREVFDGDPASPGIGSVLPVPISFSDLRFLLRGRVPGDVQRFVLQESRDDGTLLFVCRDSLTAEYVLADTTKSVMRQYQRRTTGKGVVINIAMFDVRNVGGADVPHAMDVSFDDKKELAKLRFTRVLLNLSDGGSPEPIRIPPSFKRKRFD